MKLLELFDTTTTFPYEYDEYDRQRAYIQLPNGTTAELMLGRNIGFLVPNRKEMKQRDIASLFGTISKIVSEWMKEQRPAGFQIVPSDKAKEAIYRIMVNKMTEHHPEYEVSTKSYGSVTGWVFTRKDN